MAERLPENERNTIGPNGENLRPAMNNPPGSLRNGSGSTTGRIQAMQYYGQTPTQTGADVQDIVQRRRKLLDERGPAGTALLQSANRGIMQDRAVRASQGRRNDSREQQLARSGQVAAAQSDYDTMLQNLGSFQSLTGNILAGQTGLEQGYAALEAGQNLPTPPAPNRGVLGTVICTELWRQGYMDDYTYDLDRLHGIHVRTTRPHVYFGYLMLATPVVKLMKKSKLFTKLISIPALAWAHHMAHGDNILGGIINEIGETICGVFGKIFCKRLVRNYNER